MRMPCRFLKYNMSKVNSCFIFYHLSNVLKLECGVISDTLSVNSSSEQCQVLLTEPFLTVSLITFTTRNSMRNWDLEADHLDQNPIYSLHFFIFKNRVVQPSIYTFGHLFQRNWNLYSHKNLYMNVHSSVIPNSQTLEATQCFSKCECLNKLALLYHGLLCSNKKG